MENKRCPSMIFLSIFQCSWFQPSSQPWSSNALRRSEGWLRLPTPQARGEDNPLLVVGVYNKQITYDRYPRMPDTSWAARAYTFGAIDPSPGQAMSFPTLLRLKLRIEVPLWRNVAEGKHASPDSQVEESDTDSPASGSRERSPRYAQPVPAGGVELPEVETEVATEEEDTVAEPTYAFARGFWTVCHPLHSASHSARQL